ncbi:unnamed protein product, partial [Hapterophycus canaliculatus]
MEECRGDGAVMAAIIKGNVCLCFLKGETEVFLRGRNRGSCTSPCHGDLTGNCGGEASFSLFRLLYDENEEGEAAS